MSQNPDLDSSIEEARDEPSTTIYCRDVSSPLLSTCCTFNGSPQCTCCPSSSNGNSSLSDTSTLVSPPIGQKEYPDISTRTTPEAEYRFQPAGLLSANLQNEGNSSLAYASTLVSPPIGHREYPDISTRTTPEAEYRYQPTGLLSANLQITRNSSLADTSTLLSPPIWQTEYPDITTRRTPEASTFNSTKKPEIIQNIGGTTYYYDQYSNAQVRPNFTRYPGALPHVAHMKTKSHMASYFMPEELKQKILNKQMIALTELDPTTKPADYPDEVDKYHNLVPLEPLQQKSSMKIFGLPSTTYKAWNTEDGLQYCLRRVHGYQFFNHDCKRLIDDWKKVEHPNIVTLRGVFTTRAFGDLSMVFVYDYHPGSETLLSHYFGPTQLQGGCDNSFNLLPQSLVWNYVIQLSSALKTIHSHDLACRFMDPSKILLTDQSRLRLSGVGILNVLDYESSQTDAKAIVARYQQEDFESLGKVILALACNNISGAQKGNRQRSLEFVERHFDQDLHHLIFYLLGPKSDKQVRDIMPMIGDRFYTQFDGAQLRNDVLENELYKEVENGRLFRLLCKLGTINERKGYGTDPQWSETGDRYPLKLFRDYLFHKVEADGTPWVDMGHIVQCLNKLDAGSQERIFLTSRVEQQDVRICYTYAELKAYVRDSFRDLLTKP